MFIHLKYGSETVNFVIELEKNCFITAFDVLERVGCKYEKNCFITAFDVLERVGYKYDERSNLQLVSEHGTPLKSTHVIGKAKTYRVKRLAK